MKKIKLITIVFLFSVLSCQKSCPIPKPSFSTPEGTILLINRQLNQGNPGILWKALPRSYQKDTTGLVRSFANKMDEDVWKKIIVATVCMARVIENHREYSFSIPDSNTTDSVSESLVEDWRFAIDVIKSFTQSNFTKLEKLRSFAGDEFVSIIGKDLWKSDLFRKKFSAFKILFSQNLEVRNTGNSSKVATVELTSLNEKMSVVMVKVENRWLPLEFKERYEKIREEIPTNLSSKVGAHFSENKPFWTMVFVGITSTLKQMENASSRDAFDNAYQRLAEFLYIMLDKKLPID